MEQLQAIERAWTSKQGKALASLCDVEVPVMAAPTKREITRGQRLLPCRKLPLKATVELQDRVSVPGEPGDPSLRLRLRSEVSWAGNFRFNG